MGKYLLIIGVLITCVGVIMIYAPGLLKWFGNLPGDIHIKGEHSSVFIPISSMILISLAISIFLNLFNR